MTGKGKTTCGKKAKEIESDSATSYFRPKRNAPVPAKYSKLIGDEESVELVPKNAKNTRDITRPKPGKSKNVMC